MEWKYCNWEDIESLSIIAKNRKNTVKHSINTIWWGLYDSTNNNYVGCSGLLLIAGNKGRLKSTYILKEYRHNGYGSQVVKLREQYAFEVLGLNSLSVISRHNKFWENNDYTFVKIKSNQKYTMEKKKEIYDKKYK